MMSFPKKILLELIEELALFEADQKSAEASSLNDFLDYLQFKRRTNETPSSLIQEERRANLLSQKIALLYRYGKEYMKKALADSLIKSPEEFSFLILLLKENQLSKTELIQANALALTSGAEIIKRLLKKGLITQSKDKSDRRSYIVTITVKGKKALQVVLPKMRKVSYIFTGNLNVDEQETLIALLQKLDTFHKEIYLNEMDKGLEELQAFVF